MNDDQKKKVDESWKEAVEKEKCTCDAEKGAHTHPVQVTFPLFISGLMMEGLIALGEVDHPVTKKKSASLPHAQFIIETIAMLQEKTMNNLTKEEADIVDQVLYDLRMRFVTRSKQPAPEKK